MPRIRPDQGDFDKQPPLGISASGVSKRRHRGGMGTAHFAIASHELRVQLQVENGVSLPCRESVLVTDELSIASNSTHPAIVVVTSIQQVIAALHRLEPEAVLLPRHITSSALVSVAQGCTVFSTLWPDDLSMSERLWSCFSDAAHSIPREQTALSLGITSRQLRRYLERARGDCHGFEWTRLAPLLPVRADPQVQP